MVATIATVDAHKWWERATLAVTSAARTIEASTTAFARDLSAGLASASSASVPAPAGSKEVSKGQAPDRSGTVVASAAAATVTVADGVAATTEATPPEIATSSAEPDRQTAAVVAEATETNEPAPTDSNEQAAAASVFLVA